jgi:hypothetical protein
MRQEYYCEECKAECRVKVVFGVSPAKYCLLNRNRRSIWKDAGVI